MAGGTCVVRDLGSSFGALVEGAALSGPTPIDIGDAFHSARRWWRLARRGHRPMRCLPRTVTDVDAQPDVPVDERAARPQGHVPGAARGSGRRAESQWSGVGMMVAMPLAMLVGSFAVGGPSRLATFIPMVLGAGAVAIYGGISRGRRQRRKRERQVAQHEADLEISNARVIELARAERRRLRAAGFDPTRDISTALGPRRELWQRRPGGERFLTARVGLATRASSIQLTNPPHRIRRSRGWSLSKSISRQLAGSRLSATAPGSDGSP